MAGRRPGDREPRGSARDQSVTQLANQGERPIPSQEALDALGELVQRARHATSRAEHVDDYAQHVDDARRITAPVPVIGDPHLSGTEPDRATWWVLPQTGRRWRRERTGPSSPRWLVRGVVALAVIAVLLGLADLGLLVARHGTGSGGRPLRPAAGALPPPTTRATAPPRTTSPPITSTPTTSTPATTAPTTTTAAPTPVSPTPGGPRLSSVSPAHGRPGTVVELTGTNFFSPSSGQVLARVDGQPAPTDCPTQTSCQVTIPDLSNKPATVTITVTTDSGTSNALMFRYR